MFYGETVRYKTNGFRANSIRNRERVWNGPQRGGRRLMLDMQRQKYFRFDLDDLLSAFELGENKTIVAATILNKMSSHSMDEAFDYINRLTEGGKLDGDKPPRLKALLQRYSKWR
jgi:hypothetical protein